MSVHIVSTDNLPGDRIAAVVQLIRTRLARTEANALEAFARQYFASVDAEDLAERSVEDLYGAVASHYGFAYQLDTAPKLRVYNPQPDAHGWQSKHTVIEIVNDDMPFLVDSITMEINRQGLTLHLIVHPVMCVRRDKQGQFLALADYKYPKDGHYESIIHCEVDRRSSTEDLHALEAGLLRVLADVRASVGDWPKMRERVGDILAQTSRAPLPHNPEEVAETCAFLQWVADDNFTLLGCRDYVLVQENGAAMLNVVPGSGLGVLRDSGEHRASASFSALSPAMRAVAQQPVLLTISKSNTRSTVHRAGYLDYISVKVFDADGHVVGERRVLGLLTSTAYNANPVDIPLLRRKVSSVIQRANFLPKSHAAKTLIAILEQYPRDELFQISVDELYETAMGIVRLQERQRIRLFVRRDILNNFVSCLVYVPRDKYTTELRERMQRVLMQAFNGSASEFTLQLAESALARMLIMIRTTAGQIPEYDVRALEQQLVAVARRWEDDLADTLTAQRGEEDGSRLLRRYANAFPAGYREDYAPAMAVADIEQIETLNDARHDLALRLYVPANAPAGNLRFKIFRRGEHVPLSVSLPMLEHMGVKVIEERPCKIEPTGEPVWMHDFGLTGPAGELPDFEHVRPLFQEAFLKAWHGEIENDDFNRLVLLAGLTWREVVVLRAYAKYMKQAGFTFSQAYMESTLATHPVLARRLIQLFHLRFDPALAELRATHVPALIGEIQQALDKVTNLDEDRILRQFLAMILATLRTNYYQTLDGAPKTYLSFKFDPREVPNLPEPRPMFEIFVYSPRVEGVHLRGGKVARGGLRWSDRMEDFRTEVLGLVKAQMVKNAVIVPVGSKGGFVVKNPPAGGDRESLMKEGISCYRTFLRGLLDLTDNLVGGQVVPPPQVVRHDADDPYLVVAADKGTATFSDFANAIAQEYGFWLGDAFASGGSVGYDHKKMGITARGAWESVKRHFRELGLNTQEQDFTVVGVGDMSGDVFGNGMLLSRHIRLVAAFDHRHIFIDPTPDAALGFAERERLFALPRSSWADYNAALISQGGGVWPRTAKSIPLLPQARAALGIDATVEALTPAELMRAILTAPVDLLYNGGIGTYIKAASQSHTDVGDRANDAIRVNGTELRCKVVAEGGNLGCTQLGRIEFALKGGKIHTDAIDNSAGVDCSDHEVNIKILLNAVAAETGMTEAERNQLLAEMTDEVAALVLRDNYFQTQLLSVTRTRDVALLDEQARYLRHLSNNGRLNRKIEYLPFDEQIAERRAARTGLTSPELAVMLAYSKMELYDAVLASDLPEDPWVSTALARYFPQPLRAHFPEQIRRHPLRREIISTHVVNSMINRVGPTFVFQMHEETGAAPADIVRAYLAAREVFGFVSLWQSIEALDNHVADATQTAMIVEGVQLIQRGTLWFLRRRHYICDLAGTIERFAPGVAQLAAGLHAAVTPSHRAQIEDEIARLLALGIPAELAQRVAGLEELFSALDVVEVAAETSRPTELVASVFFALGGRLGLHWLAQQLARLPAETHWQGLARAALFNDLSAQARNLTAAVLRHGNGFTATEEFIAAWEARHPHQLERCRQLFAELRATDAPDMAMLSVALHELRAIT